MLLVLSNSHTISVDTEWHYPRHHLRCAREVTDRHTGTETLDVVENTTKPYPMLCVPISRYARRALRTVGAGLTCALARATNRPADILRWDTLPNTIPF